MFVCVVLLVGVLGVGVYRLRTAHTRTDDELEVEMAWDDTALNITVNPLEVQCVLVVHKKMQFFVIYHQHNCLVWIGIVSVAN